MLTDNIKMVGKLSIKKFNENNTLIEEIEIPNLVVLAGKQHVAQRMAGYTGSSATVMTHMAIGTNNSNLVVGNTDLQAPLGPRVLLDSTVVSDATVTYSATFGPIAEFTGSIVEAGIFNASTGTTMLCRTIFPTISKTGSETIAIVWNVTVG